MTLMNFLQKVCEADEEKNKNKQKIDIQNPKKMYKNIVKIMFRIWPRNFPGLDLFAVFGAFVRLPPKLIKSIKKEE